MSSLTVRQAINTAVTALADPWQVYDLSDYVSVDDVLSSITAETVLIQYVIADDIVQAIGGEGNQGWQEDGTITLHLIVPTGFASTPTVTKGDAIREGIRGKRLTEDITVESCSPFVDFSSGSLGVNGSVHGYAASLFYVRRTCG